MRYEGLNDPISIEGNVQTRPLLSKQYSNYAHWAVFAEMRFTRSSSKSASRFSIHSEVKGIGEIRIVGTAAAIANAI